jgi:Tfp pilus assembly protein PilN
MRKTQGDLAMINLLSPESKRSIRAARLNVILRTYFILTLFVVAGMGGIYGVGFYLVANEKVLAEKDKSAGELQLAQYANATKQAETYKANLGVVKQILSNEIVYSEFLTSTAAALPSNTILSNLTLSSQVKPGTKPGATNLEARAKSYDDVLRLKEYLDKSGIFTNVSIVSTNRPDDLSKLTGIEKQYPYEATLSVIINTKKVSQ